jgi:EmrB/QacA subfamily drug resistance transporter
MALSQSAVPTAASVPASAAAGIPSVPPRVQRWTLLVVCTAIFMLLLDVTIVSVALADVQRDLHASLADLQWVVDAYTLSLAGLLLTAATLGDRIGRRRVFAAGLALFTAASLACATAGSAVALDVLRAVQGIGGALLFGTALPIIGAAFPTPAQRARAIGIFGATLAAATAVGPLVGGALVDGPGWRWIFLVNVPIGAGALLATRRLTETSSPTARRADWTGTVLLTTALLALLFGLIRGNDDGWASIPIVALFAAAAGLFAAFVGWEQYAARTGRDPMLDLGLFRVPAFTGVGLAVFAVSATLVAATAFLAIYLQNGLGYSPLETGLRVLPLTIASFVTAPVTAALLARVGTRLPLVASLVLSGAGLLLMARLDASSSWTVFVPGFVVAGIGLGIGSAASASAALSAVEPARAGMATGVVNTLRQVGIAAGVAVLGALFQAAATDRARDLLAALPLPGSARTDLVDAVGAGAGARVGHALPGTAPAAARSAVAAVGRSASADAVAQIVLVGGLVALVAAVVCAALFAVRRPPKTGTTADLSGRSADVAVTKADGEPVGVGAGAAAL